MATAHKGPFTRFSVFLSGGTRGNVALGSLPAEKQGTPFALSPYGQPLTGWPEGIVLMKWFSLVIVTGLLCLTGCGGAPELTEAERKQQEEAESKKRQEEAARRVENQMYMSSLENARAIRERAYCAPSPDSLGSLYELLKAGDSERAAAIADLTGADVLEPKTRILVLKTRPYFQGIGANLVRVNRNGRACYVPNRALAN